MMLYYQMSLRSLLTVVGMGLMTACGGGGGDESSAAPLTNAPPPAAAPAPDYTPDTANLEESANKSTELYVEPDFTFDTFKEITLDIDAIDADGDALSTLLFVSVIDSDITQLDDERLQDKALLTVAKTDANGAVYRKIEIASTATKLLLELNTTGIENEVIVTIEDNNYVSYQFK